MSWLDEGRIALARGSWGEALGILRPHDDVPEALEGMGTAAWWLDEIEGENMRQVTWVTVEEVASGDWGIAAAACSRQPT